MLQGLVTPSDEDKKAARSQALLAMGAGLLGAQRGREGQALGRGLLGATNAYTGHLQSASDRQLEKLKLARWMTGADREYEQYQRQRADELRAAMEAARQGAIIPGEQARVPMRPPDASGSPGTYQTPAGFDVNRYADSLMAINPLQALQFRQAPRNRPLASSSRTITPRKAWPRSNALKTRQTWSRFRSQAMPGKRSVRAMGKSGSGMRRRARFAL